MNEHAGTANVHSQARKLTAIIHNTDRVIEVDSLLASSRRKSDQTFGAVFFTVNVYCNCRKEFKIYRNDSFLRNESPTLELVLLMINMKQESALSRANETNCNCKIKNAELTVTASRFCFLDRRLVNCISKYEDVVAQKRKVFGGSQLDVAVAAVIRNHLEITTVFTVTVLHYSKL
jgi:hypothetical protein